jgi:HlyD family secretion protein
MPTPETNRSRPIVFIGVVLLLVILGVIGFKLFSHDPVDVTVAQVTRESLISSVSTNGKVEPIEPFYAHAASPGIIEKLYVDVGQKVKTGEMLFKLNDSDALARIASATAVLRSAELAAHDMQQGGTQDERLTMAADLNRAQTQQKQAADSLESLRTLQQKGAASPAEVASAQQRLLSATSTLQSLQQRGTQRYSSGDNDRAQAQVADAQAALKAAQASYEEANKRSPISGTVYSVPVSEYDFVPAGEDIMDIADLNRIQVRAYFDEPEIGRLAPGQSTKIIWDAKPGQTWHGHIERTPSTIITYGTRNVGECIITVDDARGDLLPNTNVNVTVTTAQRSNVLTIPREALHTEGTVNFVYKVVAGKLVRTPVQIGISNTTRVEISGGLVEKDVVALSATSNRDLANGLTVKVVQ